jgi:hypothetical protein
MAEAKEQLFERPRLEQFVVAAPRTRDNRQRRFSDCEGRN